MLFLRGDAVNTIVPVPRVFVCFSGHVEPLFSSDYQRRKALQGSINRCLAPICLDRARWQEFWLDKLSEFQPVQTLNGFIDYVGDGVSCHKLAVVVLPCRGSEHNAFASEIAMLKCFSEQKGVSVALFLVRPSNYVGRVPNPEPIWKSLSTVHCPSVSLRITPEGSVSSISA